MNKDGPFQFYWIRGPERRSINRPIVVSFDEKSVEVFAVGATDGCLYRVHLEASGETNPPFRNMSSYRWYETPKAVSRIKERADVFGHSNDRSSCWMLF
jgi:hypothetical protein